MVVERILKIASSDLNTRVKAAELYFRIGQRQRSANEYASVASAFAEKGEYDKAREFYIQANELDLENVEALIGLSRLSEKIDDIDKAFEYLDKVLAVDAGNKECLLSYSALALKKNNIEAARGALTKIFEQDSTDINAKNLMGAIYLREGQNEKAWEELLPYLDSLLDAQKWSEALKTINNFKEFNSIPVKQRLVSIYRGLGNNDMLVNELKELARLHEEGGSLHAAHTTYSDCITLTPDDSYVKDKVQQLDVKLGRATPEIDPLHPEEDPSTPRMVANNEIEEEDLSAPHVMADNEIEEEDPSTPHMVANSEIEEEDLSTPHMLINNEIDLEVSQSQVSEAITLEQFDEKKKEADFYALQGLSEEAIKIYEQLHLVSPENEDVKRQLESLRPANTSPENITVKNVMQEQPAIQDGEDTDSDYMRIRFDTDDREHCESHYDSGIELKQKGLIDEAIHEFQAAVEVSEKKLPSMRMLASCYMEKGAYPYAIAEFNKIIDALSPSDHGYLNIKYELAGAYLNNKDYNEALVLYSEIHSHNPDFGDIARQIENVRNEMRGSAENTKPRKDRVSYI
jgi:tetratricopeptide (TPR) repeat protein